MKVALNNSPASSPGLSGRPSNRQALALLWQIFFRPRAAEPYSTVRASLQWSHDDADDGVTHGGQAWLRWRSVDSFFPVSLG